MLLALVVALILLAGHTQTVFISLFGLGLYGLIRSGRRHADLLIEPALGRFRTLDFDAWERIVGSGYESGGEQLRSWLAEREAAGASTPEGVAAAR